MEMEIEKMYIMERYDIKDILEKVVQARKGSKDTLVDIQDALVWYLYPGESNITNRARANAMINDYVSGIPMAWELKDMMLRI